jgi:TP901 family phage tail tape measure protein
MGGSSTTLSIVLKLVDDASSAMQSVGSKLKSVGDSMTSAGRTLSAEVTLPIVALGTAVIETSMKFQASMELIRTQAGATQQEVDDMTKAILALSKSGETAQGPQKLADGLYHLESLGLRGKDAMAALKIAAQGADLGLANMEGVTNALGAAIVTGIKGTQSYSQAMGILDATIGQGNMRMEELVAALGTGILPAAKNFGLSLLDVGAALATLTDNGMRADESATRLRMTFSLMAAPSHKAQQELHRIGMSSFQLADDMRNNGLVAAIDDLNAHLRASGLTATQQAAVISEAFGGGRSSAAIETLLQQTERLRTKYQQIGAQADTFNEKVAATHETNLYKFNAALAQVQTTLIDLGATVMPLVAAGLATLAALLARLTAWWDTLSPTTQKWIAISLALLAALGPVLLIVGALISAVGTLIMIFTAVGPVVFAVVAAVGALSAPMLIAIGLVALLAYGVFTHWNQIINWTSNMMLTIAGIWNTGWGAIGNFFTTFWNGLKTSIQEAITFIQSLLTGLFNTVSSIASKIMAPIQSVVGAVGGIAGSIGGAVGGVIHAFASGGIVNGPTLAMVGEAGPEAIIPLSAFAGGGSLAGAGGNGGGGNIIVNINGGNYLDSTGATMIANALAKQIGVQLRLKNFN